MKIEVDKGIVSFPAVTIGPQLSRPEFLRTTIGATAKQGVVNDGWVTLHVTAEPGIHCSLIFKDDRLVQVSAMMDMPSGETEEWSEKFEMQRKACHDAWLQSQLGSPPYRFPWGTVASVFSPQDCSSDIVITFGEFPVQKSWREKDQSA